MCWMVQQNIGLYIVFRSMDNVLLSMICYFGIRVL